MDIMKSGWLLTIFWFQSGKNLEAFLLLEMII